MPTVKAPPVERRGAVRRLPALGTVCHLFSSAGRVPELGLVWNISASGISMLVSDPPPPGSHLSGRLLTMEGQHTRDIGLTIIHVRKIDTGDYLIGAQFDTPLKPEELRPFVSL